MQELSVIARIKALCTARSWTYYRLAKESGIAYSTLFTMLNKANEPSISTLQKICDGFGITMAQFFDEDELCLQMTSAEKEHLRYWMALSDENKLAIEKYTKFLLSEQKDTAANNPD